LEGEEGASFKLWVMGYGLREKMNGTLIS